LVGKLIVHADWDMYASERIRGVYNYALYTVTFYVTLDYDHL